MLASAISKIDACMRRRLYRHRGELPAVFERLELACIFHSPPKIVALVSRPAVPRASWPSEPSLGVKFRVVGASVRNAG